MPEIELPDETTEIWSSQQVMDAIQQGRADVDRQRDLVARVRSHLLRYKRYWDESKHPRDESGQFAEANRVAMPRETEILNPSKSLDDRFDDEGNQRRSKISDGRSQRLIEHWKEKIDRGGDKAMEGLRAYLASLSLGREFNEEPQDYFERQGLTSFVKWAKTAKPNPKEGGDSDSLRVGQFTISSDGRPIDAEGNYRGGDALQSELEKMTAEELDSLLASSRKGTPAQQRWLGGAVRAAQRSLDTSARQRELFARVRSHLLRYGSLQFDTPCFGEDCYRLDEQKKLDHSV